MSRFRLAALGSAVLALGVLIGIWMADHLAVAPQPNVDRVGRNTTKRPSRTNERDSGGADRNAGVRARPDILAHQFTPEAYLGFLARFDDEDLFATLDAGLRARLERELLARLRDLPPDGLRLEYPIVYVTGRRT